jgi:site-specific DNA recombinase
MESAWSNGKAAYRCRPGHTSADSPDPGRPKNAYAREQRVLAQLPALRLLLTTADRALQRRAGRTRCRTRGGIDVNAPAAATDIIGQLRERGITLTQDQSAAALRLVASQAITAQAR